MPILPPITSPPYPLLQDVLNIARERILDAIQTPAGAVAGQIGGEVLSDTNPASLPVVNAAWQRLQEALAASGAARLTQDVILNGIPVAGTADPGIQAYIDWDGYFDGQNFFPTPGLPQDLIFPLRLEERITNSGSPAAFTPMEFNQNGLSRTLKQNRNYAWEWRNNRIWLAGATAITDILIRYVQFLPDFEDIGTVHWYQSPVPIMRSTDALAWFIAAEIASARGDIDTTSLDAKADAAVQKLAGKDGQTALLRGEWIIPDIPSSQGNTPYDSVSTMLNTVRTRMNAVTKLAGDVVTANQQFTQQCVNTAWRKMQEFLAGKSFKRLETETVLTAIPATSTADPGIFCSLSWAGYFDGNALNTGVQLPQNLISPIRLFERVNGSASDFTPMNFVQNTMDNQPKGPRNFSWQWVNDQIVIPGSTSVMDIRIRFSQYLADFVQSGSTPWYLTQIPIARALDSLAWYCCFEIATSRPDLGIDPAGLAALKTAAEEAAGLLVNRDVDQAAKRSEWVLPSIPPTFGNMPYDTVLTVLNVTLARLNAVMKMPGDVITGNAFTQQCVNNAFRRMQEFLANLGYIRLTGRVVIPSLPAKISTDPSVETSISWSGYFNGTSSTSSPALPQDMIFPLWIKERISGQNGPFIPMTKIIDGLPSVSPQVYNRIWEWRADAVYFPGANTILDIESRYAQYLPDFAQSGSNPWYTSTVPIARCTDALSLYTAAEIAAARPDLGIDPILLKGQAEETARIIMNRDVRQNLRVNVTRKSASGRLEQQCAGGYRN